MQLDSCRELKLETLKIAAECGAEEPGAHAYRMRRARSLSSAERRIESPAPGPVAAIGVAPAKGDDYKLAVRIFRGRTRVAQPIVDRLERHSSEVEIVKGVNYRPRLTVRAGGSCGHIGISAGTLGGFVEDEANYYMMSNNHVLANSNFAFQGDLIIQPGPSDIVSLDDVDVIGELDRWYPLSRTDPNGFDVALATFSDSVEFFDPFSYTGIGQIENTPSPDRFAVSRVTKRGRTTGTTVGTVSAFELDGVRINYAQSGEPSAFVTFDNQIEVIGSPPSQPFSQPGDSGSFIIDRDTLQPYALLYGGGEDSLGIDRTLAHFLPDVLDEMGVSLVQ